MSPRNMLRAAEILRQQAKQFKDSFATPDGKWIGDAEFGVTAIDDRREHAEMLKLARELEALSRRRT